MRIASMTGIARRFGWGVTDQALSSLTNFALGVAVARSVSATEFGAFAIAFATYLVALNVTRHLAVQPLAIRYANVDAATLRRGTAAAMGAVLALSIFMGFAMIGCGLVIEGALGASLVGVGLTLPGLLLQDGWRIAFFTARRGASAFWNDVIWAVVLFPGLLWLETTGNATLFSIVLMWGFSGAVAGVVGMGQARIVPDPSRTPGWWREHRDIGPRNMASELATIGSTQLVLYVVGSLVSLAAAGSLRAAMLLMGPINIMVIGIYLVAVPQGARLLAVSLDRFRTACAVVSGALFVATVGTTLVILAWPDVIGPLLLGDSWPGARLVFIPIAVAAIARNTGFGARMGLAAMAEARRTLRLTSIESIASITAGVTGALTGGAVGAAWGLASVAAVMVVFWARDLLSALADRRSGPSAHIAPSPPFNEV